MENNPYNENYHKYLENLKSNLDNNNSYINSDLENYKKTINFSQNKNSVFDVKKVILFSIISIIAGISFVSFITQSVLFLFDKNNSQNNTVVQVDQGKTETNIPEDVLKEIYLRADIGKQIFGLNNSTSSTTTISTTTSTTTLAIDENLNKNYVFDINNYRNVNIPGVSRIGYDESFGNDFLTDNINKYSASTLVIGKRDIEDENIPGGGEYDENLVDKYDIVDKAILPKLNSQVYLMADLDTGEIILEKNPDSVFPIASVTKIMTGLIATQNMNLQDIAIVSKDAINAYGAQGGLKIGEKIILSDLIYPLLMESSNDAGEVFADHYGRQDFLDEMNKKARSLGMENTYYNDPSGLDPKNSSSPKDLLKLVRYIWKKDSSIFAATRVRQFSIKGHTWYNRNAQLPLSGFLGGKNGFIDQARQTTASIFEIPTLKGGNRKVVIIILRSNDKNGDVIKLINFLKKSVVYTP